MSYTEVLHKRRRVIISLLYHLLQHLHLERLQGLSQYPRLLSSDFNGIHKGKAALLSAARTPSSNICSLLIGAAHLHFLQEIKAGSTS